MGFSRSAASAPANRIGVATIEAAVTSVANAALGSAQRAGSDGGAEQHEAEFAGLRQREAEAQRVLPVLAGDARQRECDRRLGEQQHRRCLGQQ